MKAKDVMTHRVVTVTPNTRISDIAKLLVTEHISGVPVVEGDKLVGMVSEGDLIHRGETGTAEAPRSWWLNLFANPADDAKAYIKSHGGAAKDVMTKKVISVGESADLSEVANLLEKNRIKRVPVVRDGKLVGVISRANIIQALAAAGASRVVPISASDTSVRERIMMALSKESWAETSTINVTVVDGVVELWGLCPTAEERDASKLLIQNVPGVKSVIDHRGLASRMPAAI